MLLDGGSDSQACFWKLVRHLDRVDAVLITHIGTENLPGVTSFLERKVAELELNSDFKGKCKLITCRFVFCPLHFISYMMPFFLIKAHCNVHDSKTSILQHMKGHV